ncbi:hypothetical protein B0H17DRAFT_1135435 [Mycena rosella]|uniref:Uncharacterized protein n=1 Tax=Mycena rosella TaxID=1033263 RepID=A0AAD7GD70_MYCRO|nr:hypothetical protein B0H17DRAFT_1135435 [Mycena rosella]
MSVAFFLKRASRYWPVTQYQMNYLNGGSTKNVTRGSQVFADGYGTAVINPNRLLGWLVGHWEDRVSWFPYLGPTLFDEQSLRESCRSQAKRRRGLLPDGTNFTWIWRLQGLWEHVRLLVAPQSAGYMKFRPRARPGAHRFDGHAELKTTRCCHRISYILSIWERASPHPDSQMSDARNRYGGFYHIWMNLKPLPAFFLLISHSRRSLGMTNHTVDDADPSVEYNPYDADATPVPCSTDGCSSGSATSDDTDYSQMLNGTMTSLAGKITVNFPGTTVAVYFATTHSFLCGIHIDGEAVGNFKQEASHPGVGKVLGYSNTSIADGPHHIVLIAESGTTLDFDGLVYTTPPSSTVPPPISTVTTTPSVPIRPVSRDTSSATSSSPSSSHIAHSSSWTSPEQSTTTLSTARTPMATRPPSVRRPSTAAIAGSAVGGVLLLTTSAALFTFILRRRARRWNSRAVHQPFSVDLPAPATPPTPYLATHLLKLEARIDALASTAQRPSYFISSANRSLISGPPAYEDAT